MKRPTHELAARMLQIGRGAWADTLAAVVTSRGDDLDDEIRRGVSALATAFASRNPHSLPAPGDAASIECPACFVRALRPWLARRPAIVYGRCAACGHAARLGVDGAQIAAGYADPEYYRVRGPDGVGYEAYDREAAYREQKGARLVARLGSGGALLEVGCGFGYTRVAAERAGWRTSGVDLNPTAVAEARRRYGLETYRGDLARALAAPRSEGGFAHGAFDVVLYQFVLEHVADLDAELSLVREALTPGGRIALLVPSAEATEIEAFGAAYRSFRADHLHLFSMASLAALLARAGFAAPIIESHCNVHLLGDVLSPAALERLYASGRGPDLFVIAETKP